MLLSTLIEQINSAPDEALDSMLYLASPDTNPKDDVDVYVVSIAAVDIDYDKNEIRLLPLSGRESRSDGMPILMVSNLMDRLPANPKTRGDFEILVELPLNRESPGLIVKSMVRVAEFHIGATSEEAWFLVRPAADYAVDVLPV